MTLRFATLICACGSEDMRMHNAPLMEDFPPGTPHDPSATIVECLRCGALPTLAECAVVVEDSR